ncbi:MAG: Glu-tRNA(Gln) amidotransferase subunit GatD [Candidatus Poseidoniaceae archaeon]|nr:Glu-tRNA(Gln) amidotransferase subunit GatD [Candidatus Poseidoniaceae archaeon]
MVEVPSVGQRVKLEVKTHNGTTTIEGVALHPASKQHLTVKLVNGYNASYPLDQINTIETLPTQSVESKTSAEEVVVADGLPRVRILHTGGTIASKVDYTTGAVVARFEPEEMVASLPELASIANIEAVKLGNMFSDDIRPQHWNSMIQASKQAFDDGCDGVVITHGTDTLHMSSAALSFAWCGKGEVPPGRIAFVGSQRSSDRGSSDAAENLLSAVYWAAHGPQTGGDIGDGVVLVMHSTNNDGECAIYPGVGVRKLHSSRRDAFQPVNCEALGHVTIDNGELSYTSTESYDVYLKNGTERQICERPTTYETSTRIAQFVAGPWLHSEEIEAIVQTGVQAIVIQGTGLGHLPIEDPGKDAPENTKVWRALTRCINREIPIVVTNQCIHGPVDMNVYSKGRKQMEMGILGHGSIAAPDTVIVKVHWALSNDMKLRDAIGANLCGEGNNTLRT